MAGLLYYFPGLAQHDLAETDAFKADVFERFGLSGSLADVTRWPADGMVNGCKRGPDGGEGVILTPLTPATDTDKVQCLYKAERQTWLPIKEGLFWIGFWNDKPPAAPELSRKVTHGGYVVTDANGQAWTVPIARSGQEDRCSLPSYHHFDPATLELRRNLRAEYASLWEIAGAVFEFYTGQWPEDAPPPTAGQQILWAVEALAVNYRIGPAEIAVLQAAGRNPLDNQSTGNILIALCDMAVFDDTVKNLPAGVAPAASAMTSSTPTAAGARPATHSAAAN